MEPLSLSVEYTLFDWRALQRAAGRRAAARGNFFQRHIQSRLPAVALAALVVAGLSMGGKHDWALAVLLGMAVGIIILALHSTFLLRRYRPLPDGLFLGPVQYVLDTEGIRYLRSGAEARVAWSRVLGLDYTADHLFIWLDATQGYTLPARGLPASLNTPALAERIRGFMAAAGAAPAPVTAMVEDVREVPVATGDAAAVAGIRPVSVWRELGAIGRLLSLTRVDGTALSGRDLTIFLLGVILLVAWFPLDLLVFPGEMQFNVYALVSIGWVIAGVLGLAWILARLSRPRLAFRLALLLATGSLAIAIVASTLWAWVDGTWMYFVLGGTLLWTMLYFARGLRAVSGGAQPRALFTALAAAACFVVAGDQLYVNPSFWQYADGDEQTDDESSGDAQAWRQMEELQFGQQARLDEQLARIAALPHGKSANWFVGFAGYGEQREFAQEIALAQRQVAAKYGSAQRSIELVNDRRDLEKLPLASAPALRYTLESIGSMMGPDDVLFLALSSHGSEDGSVAISNSGREPAELPAVDLAEMLRDAKIPWKVVVVSACYAGGFIDPLRDDHTIVIAASAQDRTSFGCSDDRDLTYFGEAFYRDALPKAATLREAFENARTAIAKREKQDGITASDPQGYFGTAIEAKLR